MTPGRDQGSASILLLGVGAVVVVLGVGVVVAGRVVVDRHRAQSAADLGALAGAARAVEGTDAACAAAARIIEANGARMTGCTVGDALDITVEATVAGRRYGAVAGRARAGPETAAAE